MGFRERLGTRISQSLRRFTETNECWSLDGRVGGSGMEQRGMTGRASLFVYKENYNKKINGMSLSGKYLVTTNDEQGISMDIGV